MTFPHKFTKAKDIFRMHGGILNTATAIRLGIHPKTLYNMRDQGVLELVGACSLLRSYKFIFIAVLRGCQEIGKKGMK